MCFTLLVFHNMTKNDCMLEAKRKSSKHSIMGRVNVKVDKSGSH